MLPMASELDKVKFKIMSLAAKTVQNGCSEQEALSAMVGVGRLLSQYNLTMEECDVRQSKCKTMRIDIGRKNRHPIDSCVVALAGLVNARCWFERRKTSAYMFFGQEQDLELIKYLFYTIMNALESEVQTFKQSHYYVDWGQVERTPERVRWAAGLRRKGSIAFQRGMAARIHVRLHELKAQNAAELAKYRQNGNALIALKDQLVNDEFLRLNMRLRKGGPISYRITDRASYAMGNNAGGSVNLSRPLEDANEVKGLLK